MTLPSLVGMLFVMLSLRASFIWINLPDLELLWNDFENRGVKYKLAWLLDLTTFGFFVGIAILTVYRIQQIDYPIVRVFIVFFGVALLAKLQAHRFPRTNVPGALVRAKANLTVSLLMAVICGAVMAVVAAVHLWWNGNL